MIDLDTSVVSALLTPEERSPEALQWFAHCRQHRISSDWLIPETHSAMGINQRQHAAAHFERLLVGGIELLSLHRDCYRQAGELLQDHSLGLAPAPLRSPVYAQTLTRAVRD
jgi:hypothetical protein